MYQSEANAVASNLRLHKQVRQRDGHSNRRQPPALVPAGQTCLQVTIQKKVAVPGRNPRIPGSGGTLNGSPAQLITATAIATSQGGSRDSSCITALGSTGVVQDLTVNGGPNSNMAGCAVASSGDATCHGHPIGGTIASYAANGDTNDCAANANDLPDPSTPLADPIGARTCCSDPCAGNYPQEVSGRPPRKIPLSAVADRASNL